MGTLGGGLFRRIWASFAVRLGWAESSESPQKRARRENLTDPAAFCGYGESDGAPASLCFAHGYRLGVRLASKFGLARWGLAPLGTRRVRLAFKAPNGRSPERRKGRKSWFVTT
jgi:hypothetical protein